MRDLVRGRAKRKAVDTAAKLLGQAPKRATFLCSYPKSGRTWLRFVVASYLDLLFGLGIDVDFRSLFTLVPNDKLKARGLSEYHYWGDPRVPLVVASHAPYDDRFGDSDIIFMVRSPLDVLVSQYYHRTNQLHAFQGDLGDYVRDPDHGVARLVAYLNSWAEPLGERRSLVVSYEAMQADAVSVAATVAAFVGLPSDLDALKEAVDRSSFERMRDLEIRDGIPGHQYDRANPDARRVREGRVGAFREHLAAEDLEYVRSALRDRLTPTAAALLREAGVAP